MPQWVEAACNEYLTRINHGKYQAKIIDLKSDKNNNKPVDANMALEAKKITNQIPNGSFIIILDERGKTLSSIKLAQELEKIALTSPNITFIIGGADGIHLDLKNMAHLTIQLSSFTFPHALVRVVLLEQIYRCITILENHPYHRE